MKDDTSGKETHDEERWRKCARCWPINGGAWAVVAQPPLPKMWEPSWAFAYLSDRGARVDLEDPDPGPRNYNEPPFNWCDNEMWADEATTFDYDGDGLEEVILKREERFWFDVSVFTLKDGRVQKYSPSSTMPIRGFEDADEDGRPDLLLAVEIGDWSPVCDWEETEHDTTAYTPMFLAHARPDGTFSTQDAVAQEYIQRTCPASPKNPMTDVDYVCSRVWRRPTKSLLDHLSKTQIPMRCHQDASGRKISDAVPDPLGRVEGRVGMLEAAARLKPFTQL